MMSRPYVPAFFLSALVIGCGPVAAEPRIGPIVVPDAVIGSDLKSGAAADTAYFAGGCFWGVQAVFQHVKGVLLVTSGYSGGRDNNPDYESVSSGATGHAEAVRVVYDPNRVSYGTLLKVFFAVAHDPTELNRQGPDVGTQYRSAIFFATPEQEKAARAYLAQLTTGKVFSSAIVTELTPLSAFYRAEEYHQDYATLHPNAVYIVVHDAPKLTALQQNFPDLWTDTKAGS